MKHAFVIFGIALLVGGCAASGVQVKPEQLTAFQKGVTTEAEVVAALGAPNSSIVSSDGSKTIAYASMKYQTRGASFIPVVGLFAGGADMRMTSTVFRFDEYGRLISYQSTESNYGTGTGMSSGPAIPQTDQPR